ncbi:hypothetical protein P4910_24215 [Pantoea stewartii]|uniref:hypothetical protein n=1 Tax=Pantoea stewartii TaxID=66269 RepID=UPI0023F897D7|nr:hypothetical protein [Pantoea stewartii]MDF7788559.1 hypothetical protein [Pantoea stewartii]
MQAKRIYNVAFLGSNEKGSLPMFTRVEAVTANRAQKRFIEEFRPVEGWFLGDGRDRTGTDRSRNTESASGMNTTP